MPNRGLSPSDAMIRLLNDTTVLPPNEERKFRGWIESNEITDLDHPLSHYDYRGFWRENPNFSRAPEEHLTDKFKQLGHETFSNESQYARPGEGGEWFRNMYFSPDMLRFLRNR